jgi:hypothetical protein
MKIPCLFAVFSMFFLYSGLTLEAGFRVKVNLMRH